MSAARMDPSYTRLQPLLPLLQQAHTGQTLGGPTIEEILRYVDREGLLSLLESNHYSGPDADRDCPAEFTDNAVQQFLEKRYHKGGFDEVWCAIQGMQGQQPLESTLARSLLESLLSEDVTHHALTAGPASSNGPECSPVTPRTPPPGMFQQFSHAQAAGMRHHSPPSDPPAMAGPPALKTHPSRLRQMGSASQMENDPQHVMTQTPQHVRHSAPAAPLPPTSHARMPYREQAEPHLSSHVDATMHNLPSSRRPYASSSLQYGSDLQLNRHLSTSHTRTNSRNSLEGSQDPWPEEDGYRWRDHRPDPSYTTFRTSFPCRTLTTSTPGPCETTRSPTAVAATAAARAARRKKRKEPDVADQRANQMQKRMVKNRESAARSRARRQQYTSELEDEVNQLKEENAQLLLKLVSKGAAPPPEKQNKALHSLRRTRSTLS